MHIYIGLGLNYLIGCDDSPALASRSLGLLLGRAVHDNL